MYNIWGYSKRSGYFKMISACKPGSTKMCKRVTCYSTSGRLEAQDNSGTEYWHFQGWANGGVGHEGFKNLAYNNVTACFSTG